MILDRPTMLRLAAVRDSGEQPHSLIERQAALTGFPLDFLPVVQRFSQLFAVDFDPLSLDGDQAADRVEEPLDLGLGERLTVERHVDGEIEQGVDAKSAVPCGRRS